VYADGIARTVEISTEIRQLDAALHCVAMTQPRCDAPARELIARPRGPLASGLAFGLIHEWVLSYG
jgi:hypothetical protein